MKKINNKGMDRKLLILLWILLLSALIVVFLALSSTLGVAYKVGIFPGQNVSIDCSVRNDSVGVACSPSTVCKINRTLVPDEDYAYNEGVCEVNFKCTGTSIDSVGQVKFPMTMFVENKDNSSFVSYYIEDWLGNPYKNKTWEFLHEDTIVQEYKTNFICPAEIKTDINIQTCSKYLNEILQTGDPLLYQLASGQTGCMNNLINVTSDLRALDNEYQSYKVNYETVRIHNLNLSASIVECQNVLTSELDEFNQNGTVGKWKARADSKVEYWWQWLAIALIVMIVIIILMWIYSGSA